jgi:hypothetical protein
VSLDQLSVFTNELDISPCSSLRFAQILPGSNFIAGIFNQFAAVEKFCIQAFMAPQEIPRFYLYSLGLPPAELTLGTLIFGNYAQPEGRCAVFQGQVSRIRSILRAAHVEISRVIEDDHVNRQEVSGCWTTKKESKYGLGIEAIAELASIGIEYVRSRKKVVFAESGSRLVLRE